jgi:hypothetical protein
MMVIDAMKLITSRYANKIDEVWVEIFFQNPEGKPQRSEGEDFRTLGAGQ